jgi:hypothetical protein
VEVGEKVYHLWIDGIRTNLWWWKSSYKWYRAEDAHRKKMEIRGFIKAIRAGIKIDWNYHVDTCSFVKNWEPTECVFLDCAPDRMEILSIGDYGRYISEFTVDDQFQKEAFCHYVLAKFYAEKPFVQLCDIVNFTTGEIFWRLGVIGYKYGYSVFAV